MSAIQGLRLTSETLSAHLKANALWTTSKVSIPCYSKSRPPTTDYKVHKGRMQWPPQYAKSGLVMTEEGQKLPVETSALITNRDRLGPKTKIEFIIIGNPPRADLVTLDAPDVIRNRHLQTTAKQLFKKSNREGIPEPDCPLILRALFILDSLLKINPSDIRAEVLKGKILRAINRQEEALEIHTRAYRVAKDYTSRIIAMTELVRSLRKNGRIDEALEILEKELLSNPGDNRLYTLHGQFLESKERYDEALRQYEVSHGLYKFNPRNILPWSHLLIRLGREEEAKALLLQTQERDPHNSRINSLLRRLLRGGL